jgi:hypothetical protein
MRKNLTIFATYFGIVAILVTPIYYVLYGITAIINFKITSIYLLSFAILVDILIVITHVNVYYKK